MDRTGQCQELLVIEHGPRVVGESLRDQQGSGNN
jgi:hypothetical protein